MKPSDFDFKHKGQPGVVIGGGPSVDMVHLDKSKFPDDTVYVGCKQVWRRFPVDYMVSTETNFVKLEMKSPEWGEAYKETEFIKFVPAGAIAGVTLDDTHVRLEYSRVWNRDVRISKQTGWHLVPKTLDEMYIDCMSGTLTIKVAYMLGLNPIYLLGLDGVAPEGKTHWHDDYRRQKRTTVPDYTLEMWKFIYSVQQNTDTRFISISPISRLNKYLPYEEI